MCIYRAKLVPLRECRLCRKITLGRDPSSLDFLLSPPLSERMQVMAPAWQVQFGGFLCDKPNTTPGPQVVAVCSPNLWKPQAVAFEQQLLRPVEMVSVRSPGRMNIEHPTKP